MIVDGNFLKPFLVRIVGTLTCAKEMSLECMRLVWQGS